MAENSKIEWTDHTFNPWVGCTKISPACDHCYAEGWAKRSGLVQWGGDRRRTSDANWRKPLKWDRQAKHEGRRARVFCASLADVFDNQVPNEWRIRLFGLIHATPRLDWLLLTKRPQNVAKMIDAATTVEQTWGDGWPNVWIGTTVENQPEADRRLPHLQATGAALRFLSVEPMIGSVRPNLAGIGWVICGGESGPHARPMSLDWVRALRDQCAAANVPFLFKQRIERGMKISLPELDGRQHVAFPVMA